MGVLKDSVMAHMYFNIAAANGGKKGAEYRCMLEKAMTPSQIAEAQKLYRELMKKHE